MLRIDVSHRDRRLQGGCIGSAGDGADGLVIEHYGAVLSGGATAFQFQSDSNWEGVFFLGRKNRTASDKLAVFELNGELKISLGRVDCFV